MAFRFSVLASSSSGNAAFLEADGSTLLIDFGIPVRTLARRLEQVFASWDEIRGVLLTHTHSDHWNEATLKTLLERRIPLWCLPQHVDEMARNTDRIEALEAAGLLRRYADGEPFEIGNVRVVPFAVPHDGPTCGFRVEGKRKSFALAYATDLGSWNAGLADRFSDVDLLSLEFNHDVEMERTSGRHPALVKRVLGHYGHLSNESAATLLSRTLESAGSERLAHVVLTHLSRQCNRPALARRAAEEVRARHGRDFEVHVATPNRPTPCLAPRRKGRATPAPVVQPTLPGWDD